MPKHLTTADRAHALWATADELIARAAHLEQEAKELREKAEAINTLAVDVADGRL